MSRELVNTILFWLGYIVWLENPVWGSWGQQMSGKERSYGLRGNENCEV